MVSEVKEQIIWYNSHLRVDDEIMLPSKALIDKGVVRICNLLTDNDQFLHVAEFINYYDLTDKHWLWYCQLISCIPQDWKIILKEKKDNAASKKIDVEFLKHEKVSHKIYQILIKNKYTEEDIIPYADRWFKSIDSTGSIEQYQQLFVNLHKVSDVVKLNDFQYRLLLGKIFTNNTLVHWKIVDTATCEWCKLQRQTPVHLFITCPKVVGFWKTIEELFAYNLEFKNYYE